jgi:thiosulfate/3-mercaptopyruvate sulfurtransferase
MDPLVSTEWLANEMGAGDLRIVDASNHLPDAGRDPRAEYEAGHIPGALFLDLASLVDTESPVPAALPKPEQFARRMQQLGIGDGSRIVVYDDSAVKTSARAWFMLTMFGAQNVAILDGGLAKWKAEGRPLDSGAPYFHARHFTAWHNDDQVRSKAQVLANISSKAEQLVDARGAGRFTGEEPEIRPGLASGHIPGSRSLPFTQLLNEDGTFKDKAGLRAAFEAAGVDLSRPVVTTCGSGVTACVLGFAMHLLGKEDAALYDGSWSEWAADPATPKALGPAE